MFTSTPAIILSVRALPDIILWVKFIFIFGPSNLTMTFRALLVWGVLTSHFWGGFKMVTFWTKAKKKRKGVKFAIPRQNRGSQEIWGIWPGRIGTRADKGKLRARDAARWMGYSSDMQIWNDDGMRIRCIIMSNVSIELSVRKENIKSQNGMWNGKRTSYTSNMIKIQGKPSQRIL